MLVKLGYSTSLTDLIHLKKYQKQFQIKLLNVHYKNFLSIDILVDNHLALKIITTIKMYTSTNQIIISILKITYNSININH